MKDLENPEADLPTQGAGDSAKPDVSGLGLSTAQLEGMKKLQQKRKEAKAAKDKEKQEKDRKKGALVSSVIGGKLKAGAKNGPAKTSDQTADGEGAKA